MIIDYVCDLHLDNAAMAGPVGWCGGFTFDGRRTPGAATLLVGGDTANHAQDTADFLNAARDHYARVIAIYGNHEGETGPPSHLRGGVRILDDGELFERLPGSVAGLDRVVVGACLAPDDEDRLAEVARLANLFQADESVGEVYVLSHYAPSARIGALVGAKLGDRANDLIDRLDPPGKPTTLLFGHLHIPMDRAFEGFRLVSHPRGYRARRRDGSLFDRFKAL